MKPDTPALAPGVTPSLDPSHDTRRQHGHAIGYVAMVLGMRVIGASGFASDWLHARRTAPLLRPR